MPSSVGFRDIFEPVHKQYTVQFELAGIICHIITCQDRFHTSAVCPGIMKWCACVERKSDLHHHITGKHTKGTDLYLCPLHYVFTTTCIRSHRFKQVHIRFDATVLCFGSTALKGDNCPSSEWSVMCRPCCEYHLIQCRCPSKGSRVGYTVPCCRNALDQCDPCIIHPGTFSLCHLYCRYSFMCNNLQGANFVSLLMLPTQFCHS